MISVDVSVKNVYKKDYVWNLATCNWENEKYLASIMDDLELCVIKLQSHTRKKKILMKKRAACETQNFYILLAFLLITIALLIAVSIYSYLIKYRAKQKYILPFNFTNNKLKETMY